MPDLTIWTFLLAAGLLVSLICLVLSAFKVNFSIPAWVVWAILALVCFILLFNGG